MADPRHQPLERRHAFYSGNVQGVGFRFAARQVAEGFDATGFVRNLPDGRVELIVEGTPAELDRFLAAIAGRMSGYIREAKVDAGRATGEFAEFEIRH
jgi:acylphosphatase